MANRPRRLLLICIHAATLLCGGPLLRWRLETFGLYMPSYPNRRPWWRVNGRALRRLLGHGGAYADWLAEMDALRRDGAEGWWRQRLGDGYGELAALVARERGDPGDDVHAEIPALPGGSVPDSDLAGHGAR